ncbi:MAG: endospore germination permease [Bacillota bacterium]|nr:endospore germination permease [Bacillota bacterium]MDP4170845.1 endospore germination permease [Bacillota bacterium]
MKQEKISPSQFLILVFIYTLGSSVLIVSAPIVLEARQNGWISAIIAIAVGMLLIRLYISLYSLFPELTLVEICEKVLGKYIGKMVSFFYFSFFFLLSTLVLNNIGSFLLTQIYVETPFLLVNALFVVVVIVGVYYGLAVIARTSEIFAPWVVLLFMGLVILNMPNIDIRHILPLFEGGIKPILRGTIPLIGIPYFELVSFLMIIPSVNDHKKAKRAFWVGGLLGGAALFIVLLVTILVFGAGITQNQQYPTYILGKKIHIGNFLRRIEVIVAILWFLSMFFKMALLFYSSAKSFSQLFKLSDERMVLLPFGTVTLVLSINVYPNVAFFIQFVTKTWPVYAMTYGLILPVLLVMIAKIRKHYGGVQKSK